VQRHVGVRGATGFPNVSVGSVRCGEGHSSRVEDQATNPTATKKYQACQTATLSVGHQVTCPTTLLAVAEYQGTCSTTLFDISTNDGVVYRQQNQNDQDAREYTTLLLT
jgi:hypothetical protein